MITDLLFGFVQTVISWALAPFPSDTTQTFDYVNQVASHLGDLNYFLPIAETVGLVVAVFALFPVFLGITLSLWVVAQLRGSSSIG